MYFGGFLLENILELNHCPEIASARLVAEKLETKFPAAGRR